MLSKITIISGIKYAAKVPTITNTLNTIIKVNVTLIPIPP
jgi:hypothetical protein